MDKNQLSQRAHAGVLFTVNRTLFGARFFVLALFLALSLASLQPRASAQAADQTLQWNKASITSHQPRGSAWNCQACEQALTACLAGGGGASCGAQYDACLAGCH
jgi:hypothetical protein